MVETTPILGIWDGYFFCLIFLHKNVHLWTFFLESWPKGFWSENILPVHLVEYHGMSLLFGMDRILGVRDARNPQGCNFQVKKSMQEIFQE